MQRKGIETRRNLRKIFVTWHAADDAPKTTRRFYPTAACIFLSRYLTCCFRLLVTSPSMVAQGTFSNMQKVHQAAFASPCVRSKSSPCKVMLSGKHDPCCARLVAYLLLNLQVAIAMGYGIYIHVSRQDFFFAERI